jgi:AcrR family transcriptional regulator
MARAPAPDSRERILHAASRLFYAHGVRAVGTDRVVAAAGTGKKLLYQHFPTKDDLVAAYLELVRERRTAATRQARAGAGADPGDQLIAIVAEVGELLHDPTFRGCAFRNYLVEHPGPRHTGTGHTGAGRPDGGVDPSRLTPAGVAYAYLTDSRAAVDALAAQLGTPEPAVVAEQVWLIIDALYLRAAYRTHLDGDVDGSLRPDVDAAVRLARTVVDAAGPTVRRGEGTRR